MNPDIIKLIQRLFITILGSGILIAGLVLIFKGISGKINLLIQGAGVKVKLINASPGVLVTLLGGCLIWYSMNDFSIQRKTIVSESNTNIEEQWLENSYKISGDETYIGIIDTIVGKGQNKRFKVEYYTVAPPKKLQ